MYIDALDVSAVIGGDQLIVWTPQGLSRLVPPRPPAAAVEPRLVSIRHADGAVHLTVAVESSRLCTLETSSDLKQWVPAGTQTAAAAQIEFADTPDPETTQRYYRVKQE